MTDPAPAASTVPVPPSWVLAHTQAAVASAAAALWPGEPVVVGPQLPSVTNYVAALQAGQGHYVAKYSLLGTSLISVVRGLRGPWPDVVRRQRAYLADPHAQLAREGAQLRDLVGCARRCGSPVRFPRVVGYEAGVLVTTAVPGASLATELLRGRREPDELLTEVLGCAQQLHGELTAPGAVSTAALASPHTCIAATFERKFLGRGATEYLGALAEGWVEPRARARIRQS